MIPYSTPLDHTNFRRKTSTKFFRFFGQTVEIHSDSPSFFDNFVKAYKRFSYGAENSQEEKALSFTLLCSADNPWGVPVLLHGNSFLPLSDTWLLREVFVYETILTAVLQRVRSHILIHAGAVARNSSGVILAADSGHGKTTLVLELIRRGFYLLSDELAAFGRSDGLLHPFPRSLRIRSTSLPLIPGLDLPEDTPTWTDKLLVDPEVLRQECVGKACPPRAVVIMRTPPTDLISSPQSPNREISVMVAHLDEGLLTFIRDHPETMHFEIDSSQFYPSIHIKAFHSSFASEIEEYGRRNGVIILDVIRRDTGIPVFAGPASLVEIPVTQALVELLRRFEPGHNSDLFVHEYKGQSSRMFFEMASILKDAHAYLLTPGPLQDMADFIESLVND